jgi:hypothetical protein
VDGEDVGSSDDTEGDRVMTPLSESDMIEIAHISAQTPTPGQHDIADPDPYCFGDDPCACVQIKAAREDERRRILNEARRTSTRVPDTTHDPSISTHDRYCPPGLGKPDRDECPVCLSIKTIRADERIGVMSKIVTLKGRSCPDPDCTDFEIAVWRAAHIAGGKP